MSGPVRPQMLTPGAFVMVTVGSASAKINHHLPVICLAQVMHAVDDSADCWWLNVHTGAGTVLPQMYRAEEILGVPALGLKMVT